MTPKNKQLLQNLRGINLQSTSQEFKIAIYPCSNCDCGSINFWMGYVHNDFPVINIDITNDKGLKIATDCFNYFNEFENEMTTTNFLTLLNKVFIKSK